MLCSETDRFVRPTVIQFGLGFEFDFSPVVHYIADSPYAQLPVHVAPSAIQVALLIHYQLILTIIWFTYIICIIFYIIMYIMCIICIVYILCIISMYIISMYDIILSIIFIYSIILYCRLRWAISKHSPITPYYLYHIVIYINLYYFIIIIIIM